MRLLFLISILVLGGCFNQSTTKEKLIRSIETARLNLESFHADYSVMLLTEPNGAIVYDRKKVSMDEGRLLIEHTYGDVPGAGEQFLIMTAVNERGAVKYFDWTKRAICAKEVTSDFLPELEWQNGLFEFMLYDPFAKFTKKTNSFDLAELVRSKLSRVRPMKEKIGDFNCRVLDIFFEGNDYPYLSVWIDEERGYLPVLQRFYALEACEVQETLPGEKPWSYVRRVATTVFLLQREVLQVHEAKPDFWIPTFATRQVSETGAVYRMEAYVSFPSEYPPDFFDLERNLPPSVRLVDM